MPGAYATNESGNVLSVQKNHAQSLRNKRSR